MKDQQVATSKKDQFFPGKAVSFFPFFLVLYEFAVNSSNDMYLPALPTIASEFLISYNRVQRTISAWLAGAVFLQLILGPLSDMKGRRFVLFLGGILFLTSSLGCTASNSISLLLFYRFLQGIGVCTLSVSGYASIHELYDEKKAVEVLALMGAVAVIAPMVGPFLGGIILTYLGWRSTFYILFISAALALLGLFFVMPETNQVRDHRALNPIQLAKTYCRILTNSEFVLSTISYGLLYGGVMSWITASPFLFINIQNLTPTNFGLVQFPIFLSYILGIRIVKPLLKQVGVEGLISIGLTVTCTGGVSLLVISNIFPSWIFGLLGPMALYSFGFGLVSASLNRKTLFSTQENLGAATAILGLGMEGLGALGSYVVSFVFNKTSISATGIIAGMIGLSWIVNTIRVRVMRKSFQRI